MFKFKGEYIDTSKISLALFHNNSLKKEVNEKKSFLILLLILSSWIIINHITRIIEPLMIFDYWMFELLFPINFEIIFLELILKTSSNFSI